MICEHCKGGEDQDHSKCPGGTWCDCGHPREKQEDEARERQVDVRVLTWDWKENAPLDVISRMINGMPTAFMYEVDTGSDCFALVISPIALDQDEVKVAFAATRSSWGLDEEDQD